jgi:hypothetical protein
MISIDTYVYHKKEGMFFPINDCPMIDICHLPGRFEFLEGCISIQYYGSEILGKDYWDDIIPLWKNIIDGAETYAINGSTTIFFPDSGNELKLNPANKSQIIFSLNSQRCCLPQKDFFYALLEAGKQFFRWLEDEIYVQKCKALIHHL